MIYEKQKSEINLNEYTSYKLFENACDRKHFETAVDLLFVSIPETDFSSRFEFSSRLIQRKWKSNDAFYQYIEDTPIDRARLQKCVNFLHIQKIKNEVKIVRLYGVSQRCVIPDIEATRRHFREYSPDSFPKQLYINLLHIIACARSPEQIWSFSSGDDNDSECEIHERYDYTEIQEYARSLIPSGEQPTSSYRYLIKE